MRDDLVTSHYATLLYPHEAGKPKASLTFKQCRYDLETVHIILTLSHYHTSSNHLLTLKLFIFQVTRNPYIVHFLPSNLKLPNLHPLLMILYSYTLPSPFQTSTFDSSTCRKRVPTTSYTFLMMMRCKLTSIETSSLGPLPVQKASI